MLYKIHIIHSRKTWEIYRIEGTVETTYLQESKHNKINTRKLLQKQDKKKKTCKKYTTYLFRATHTVHLKV